MKFSPEHADWSYDSIRDASYNYRPHSLAKQGDNVLGSVCPFVCVKRELPSSLEQRMTIIITSPRKLCMCVCNQCCGYGRLRWTIHDIFVHKFIRKNPAKYGYILYRKLPYSAGFLGMNSCLWKCHVWSIAVNWLLKFCSGMDGMWQLLTVLAPVIPRYTLVSLTFTPLLLTFTLLLPTFTLTCLAANWLLILSKQSLKWWQLCRCGCCSWQHGWNVRIGQDYKDENRLAILCGRALPVFQTC